MRAAEDIKFYELQISTTASLLIKPMCMYMYIVAVMVW